MSDTGSKTITEAIESVARELGENGNPDARTLVDIFGEAVGRGMIKELRNGGLLPAASATAMTTTASATASSEEGPPKPKVKRDHICRNVMGGYTGRCSICAKPIKREE